MGWTHPRVDVSILRSDPGKLYKPVNLLLVFTLKILHWVNFGGSDLLNWINMWISFFLKSEKRVESGDERNSVWWWVRHCVDATVHTLTHHGFWPNVQDVQCNESLWRGGGLKRKRCPSPSCVFTSFILMPPLQTASADRISFQLILLQADKPLLFILKTT